MENSEEKETIELKSRSDLNKRLLTAMLDPEQVIFSNSLFVVLEDKYPKSEWHFLVVPWKDIPTIREVTLDDLELLKMMDMFGREIAYENIGNNSFWMGYHVEPTMYRLHLHVLSTDFCGIGMNSIRHWNSFTTPFFVESERVIQDLEKYGRIDLPSTLQCKNFLATPLKCYKCSHMPKNVNALNKHLLVHKNNC
ncbi:unnamed protein product [Nezara viridula]|uniref:HIT domain-containing protein n=1 Tax=Nezara viridula TaxID=85310 RepID=A0A9P0MP75_NEZVI|nr:unnamed protein product [Nezara viridula]